MDKKPDTKHTPGLVIRFDGPPGPEAGRFVEVEIDGKSVNIGEWKQDGDYWLLVFDPKYAAGPNFLEVCKKNGWFHRLYPLSSSCGWVRDMRDATRSHIQSRREIICHHAERWASKFTNYRAVPPGSSFSLLFF